MPVFIRIILGVICLLSLGATTVYAQTGHPFADNSDFDVCTQSLMRSLDAWDTNLGTIDYLREAKNRGFSIKDCANIIKSQKATTASNSDSQSNATGRNTVGSHSRDTNLDVCSQALNHLLSDWEYSGGYRDYVSEAKKRGFTVQQCVHVVAIQDKTVTLAYQAPSRNDNATKNRIFANASNLYICQEAMNYSQRDWDLSSGAKAYVEEAKTRGFTVEKCAKIKTNLDQSVSPALIPLSDAPTKNPSYGSMTDEYICGAALDPTYEKFYKETYAFAKEALARGLTVDQCRAKMGKKPLDPNYQTSTTTIINTSSQESIQSTSQNTSKSLDPKYAAWSNKNLCQYSLNKSADSFDQSTAAATMLSEVIARGLSLDDCRQALGKQLVRNNLLKILNGRAALIGYRRTANNIDGTNHTEDFNWLYNINSTGEIFKKQDNFHLATKQSDRSTTQYQSGVKQEWKDKDYSTVIEIDDNNFVDHFYYKNTELYKLSINVTDNSCEAKWDIIDPSPIGVLNFNIGPISCSLSDANIDLSLGHDHVLSDQQKIEAEAELQALKDQIAKVQFEQTKADKDQLVKIDQVIVSARSKLEVLNVRVKGYQELQVTMKANFESKLQISIKQITGHISDLSAAKVTLDNVDKIKQIQRQLVDIKSKSISDDQLYQFVSSKIEAVRKEIGDEQSDLKLRLEVNLQILDAQRKADMDEILAKLVSLSSDINTSQEKIDADIAEFKTKTSAQFSQIASSIDDLNARTAQLEKDQKELAKKQADLAQQQSNTDKRLTATNQLLANILLPVTERADDWMMRVAAVPVQQQQFCRIVDRFYDDLAAVYKVRNDIKKNALYKDRQQDLAALLPAGAINSWIVRVVEVTQAADGSAAVMLQPPCRAMLGSDACSTDQKKFRATIAPETLMYRELARLNSGDFVTISGTILYAQTSASTSPLPQYALYEPNKHCSAADGAKQEDVFVTELTNLAALR